MKEAIVDRPVRPARMQTLTAAMMGGSPRDRYPYRRGMSAGANGTGYNNPYKFGIDYDDYIHGYLDAIELADAIEKNKNDININKRRA
ncbi:MAG: hypothetical protein ACXW04_01205 [Methylobacter sp.]